MGSVSSIDCPLCLSEPRAEGSPHATVKRHLLATMSSWRVPALPHFRCYCRLVVQSFMHVKGSTAGNCCSRCPAQLPAVSTRQLVAVAPWGTGMLWAARLDSWPWTHRDRNNRTWRHPFLIFEMMHVVCLSAGSQRHTVSQQAVHTAISKPLSLGFLGESEPWCSAD